MNGSEQRAEGMGQRAKSMGHGEGKAVAEFRKSRKNEVRIRENGKVAGNAPTWNLETGT